MKPRNPKKHAGGKPISYHFKPMMLCDFFDELSPKGLQRNGSASKLNKDLLTELGLNYSPNKSNHTRKHMEKWVQSCSENSMILPCLNSKKMWREESKETHICRLIRTENKQKESMGPSRPIQT